MKEKGRNTNGDTSVLCWPGPVLCADDLRRHLNGRRELVVSARAIITPLAAEELRDRGVQVRRQDEEKAETAKPGSSWVLAQEKPDSLVVSVVRALERDGLQITEWSREPRPTGSTEPRPSGSGELIPARWGKIVAESLGKGQYRGVVVFCQDPGLVCCVANKVAGVRAVPVVSVAQAARSTLSLAANLLAVEMPGRTFFEIRQILRTVYRAGRGDCPQEVATILQELDGHAHR